MTDFTTVFSPNKFNVNDEVILKYFLIEISTKMVETYTYGTIKMYLQLVIHEREKTSKRLDKYIAGFGTCRNRQSKLGLVIILGT